MNFDMYWHGEPSEVFWMLYFYRDKVTVICVQDFDLGDYHADKFVRNSAKQCHAFNEEEKAIEFLNQKYTQDEIDPEYWRGGDSFLVRD